MTPGILMATGDSLSGALRSVNQHFQAGGSFFWSMVVLVGTVGLVYLTYVVSVRLRRDRSVPTKHTPRPLFQVLMQQLELTDPQRRLLDSVAVDLHLPHPLVLLLSVKLFDSRLDEWHDMQRQLGRVCGDRFVVEKLRKKLFPGIDPPFSEQSAVNAVATAR